MSLRKSLHNAFAAKLDAKTGSKWTDMWKGQINRQRTSYPFNFPANFVSIRNIPWQGMTVNHKEGTAIIDVYVFFDKYGDTFEGASDKANSLTMIDYLDTLANELHWMTDEGSYYAFGETTQIGEEDLTDRYDRPAHRITFQCQVGKMITPAIHVSN